MWLVSLLSPSSWWWSLLFGVASVFASPRLAVTVVGLEAPQAARATDSHQGPANAVAPTLTTVATVAMATTTPRQGDVDYRNARATVDSKAGNKNQGGSVNGNSNDNSKTDDDNDQDGDDNDQDGDGDGYDHNYDYVTQQ
ncbi:hypothetical protein EDB83DRAFT_2326162 [Lactarius deliciosus]|nr:hypothetical protein EDB83DRAFT_2326162 [Lactarius deliciosus]